MYQIQFRLGLRPRPRWGSLERSTDPLAGLRGLTSKGEGDGKGMRGRKGKGEVWTGRGALGIEGRERDPTLSRSPNPYFWIRPCHPYTNYILEKIRLS